jgi:GNAT superfamily N-acetyltransferase
MYREREPREIDPSGEIVVATLQPHEVEEFAKLFADVVGASPYYPEEGKAKLIAKMRPEVYLERLADPEQKAILFGARNNGRMVGFVSGMLEVFEDAPQLGLLGNIRWIGVADSHRERHVGTQLLRATETRCREGNATYAVGFIKDANTTSQTLFTRRGFCPDPRVPTTKKGGVGGQFYSKSMAR